MNTMIQIEYKDDWNRTHIAFIPKAEVSAYKIRFDEVKIQGVVSFSKGND
jgi:hypothetical protein